MSERIEKAFRNLFDCLTSPERPSTQIVNERCEALIAAVREDERERFEGPRGPFTGFERSLLHTIEQGRKGHWLNAASALCAAQDVALRELKERLARGAP